MAPTAPPSLARRAAEPERSPLPVWVPGALVVAVLGVLRLDDRELWVDEVFSLAATQDLGPTLSATHGTMGLYYVLLTPWAAVSTSAPWLRGLSLLLMAGAVAVLAATVGRWHGRAAGLCTGLVVACAYLPARLAVEARSYALVALLVVLSWAALERVVAGGARGRWWTTYVACVLLIPLTHGLAALQVVVQVAAVAAARPDPATWRRHTAVAALSGVVVLALLASGIDSVGNWLDPLSPATAAALGREVLHPLPVLAVLAAAAALAGTLLLARAHPGVDPVDRFRRVALALWGPGALAAVLLLSAMRPSHLGRYSVGAALGLAGLIGVALARIPTANRAIRVGVVASALVLLLVGQHAVDLRQPRPWTDTAAAVAVLAQPGDSLLFTDPEVRLPFEVAWMTRSDRPSLHLVEPQRPLGELDRFPEVASARDLSGRLAPGSRIWLVHQTLPHATNRRPELLDDPAFAAAVEVVERRSPAPNIEVRLLVVKP